MTTAVALMSGGLDSTLAAILILEQNISVKGIQFMTYFGCGPGQGGSCGQEVKGFEQYQKRGIFELKLCHLGEDYIQIVKSPSHGYGKKMNPCIDCRILMLKYAKEYMKQVDASFVITGEVLNQRPMSQTRQTLKLIEKEAGLEGLVLRPLSAKLLPPSIPEKQALVNRDLLLDIQGRSRKRQLELARKFNLPHIPQPAGGCFLVDPEYSYKLKDLLGHVKDASVSDFLLLRYGRHFRLSPKSRLIVSRNLLEVDKISELATQADTLMSSVNKQLIGVIRGHPDEEELTLASQIIAHYAKESPAEIIVRRNRCEYKIYASPVDKRKLELLRISEAKIPIL